MIEIGDIEKIMPSLQENWINPGPNGRMRWEDRDTWQSVFLERETMRGMLEIINGLENVSDMTVLDLGCEAGLFSVILSQKFKKVIALDSDETSIKNAKKTLEIFDSFGFDVSNIEVEHNDYTQSYHNNFDNIDALYKVDSYSNKFAFFEKENILHHLKLLILTDREDFNKPLDERKSHVDKLRKKFKEFNYELSEFKTMKRCKTSDVYIGRRNETKV